MPILKTSLASLLLCLVGLASADPIPGHNSAIDWINTREAEWFNHKSPEIIEGYPFGRSNAANNLKLADAFGEGAASSDYTITNKQFLAEGDWYVVEWFYSAKNVKSGAWQREGSLCFAQIKDQQLVQWIEYFDDTVGELQMTGLLPLYAPSDEPFPWPEATYQHRVYRP